MANKRINLADYIERRIADAGIDVELDDGTTVTIPPYEMWPDGAFEAIGDRDTTLATRLVLGDEQAARFEASGGNWRMISGIINQMEGASVGESGAPPSS